MEDSDWCSNHKQQGSRSRNTEVLVSVETSGPSFHSVEWPSIGVIVVHLEDFSDGTLTAGFSPGRLNVGVVYLCPDPVDLDSHRHGQNQGVKSFPAGSRVS